MQKQVSALVLVASCLLLGAGCTQAPQSNTVTTTPAAEDTQTSLAYSDTMQPSNSKTWTFQGELPADRIQGKQVRVTTAKGDIVIELLPDVAPVTVSNFVYLAEGGFYDGLVFHRREEGFVIQGGDPLGNGTGGPGYTIPAEFNETKHERGMVAMARAMDPNSAGSQFYITLAPAYFLDNNYTVFGRVLEGMEIADQIKVGDAMTKVTIEDKK
jgi:cyclophilin family peptidyl-prolyl cis-trans isomerase